MFETVWLGGLLTLVILLTCAVTIALVWVFIALSDKSAVLVGLLFLAFLFEVFMIRQPYLNLGVNVFTNDVIYLLLIATICLGSFKRALPVRDGAFLLWLALGCVISISFAIGLGKFGSKAGIEVRDYFYYWVAGLFFLTAEFSKMDIQRIGRWSVYAAYALIGIAAYRWIGVTVGVVPEADVRDVTVMNEFRALPAIAAFYLAMVALVQLMAWLRGTGASGSGWSALLLTGFVVVLQHRSVWLAYFVGLAFILIQERKALPRRFSSLLGAILMCCILIGIAASAGMLDSLVDALLNSVETITAHRSTVTDRIFGWEELMTEWTNSSMGTWLLGFPYGHGFRRVLFGKIIEFSPHNFYVALLLRVGVVGLTMMLLATLIALARSLTAKTESEFDYLLTRGMGIILLASLVYYVPYWGTYLHGAVTGLALAQCARLRRAESLRTVGLPNKRPVIADQQV